VNQGKIVPKVKIDRRSTQDWVPDVNGSRRDRVLEVHDAQRIRSRINAVCRRYVREIG
jgi:hypothetical protein